MGYEKRVEPGVLFHTMHSPRGANASFAFGGNVGAGFLHNDAGIPQQDIFIGYKSGSEIKCFPFFQNSQQDGEDAYDFGGHKKPDEVVLRPFRENEIRRELSLATDTFSAPGITFSVVTPVAGMPDPDAASAEEVKRSIMPAVPARITIDNTHGSESVCGIFGVQEMLGVFALSDSGRRGMEGAIDKKGCGFAYDTSQLDGRIQLVADFSPERVFQRTSPQFYRLDTMSGFIFEVYPGECVSVNFVLGWYDGGVATRGAHQLKYYYTRFFPTADEMFAYAVMQTDCLFAEAEEHDTYLNSAGLSAERKLLLAQAMHCYYASTMLFDDGDRPRYVVNEGTYVMHNTFDLSVDHLYYEILYQPWTVRNQLDSFADEYYYYDTVHPHDNPDIHYPGGIAFTHDQGIHNTFSPKGHSAYEHINRHGCLSYMSHEQLVNWIVSAGVYFNLTNDVEWLTHRKGVILNCLTSMLNRDHYDPAQRDGIMDFESDRCGISSEITTFDSIDPSLGQARRNMYLATKCFGAYICICRMLKAMDDPFVTSAAKEAMAGAKRAAETIVMSFDEKLGYIPALLDGADKTAIIPAIEGLIFPKWAGMPEVLSFSGEFADLMQVMKRHFIHVMKPGRCLFDDGGWRLSASSINSWMSKICLCQYISETILGVRLDGQVIKEADEAHVNWWTNVTRYCPGIDQIFWGKNFDDIKGFHYPRAITAILYLQK